VFKFTELKVNRIIKPNDWLMMKKYEFLGEKKPHSLVLP
jgi:hypothetical protein